MEERRFLKLKTGIAMLKGEEGGSRNLRIEGVLGEIESESEN